MSHSQAPTLAVIEAAHQRIQPFIHRTPILTLPNSESVIRRRDLL